VSHLLSDALHSRGNLLVTAGQLSLTPRFVTLGAMASEAIFRRWAAVIAAQMETTPYKT